MPAYNFGATPKFAPPPSLVMPSLPTLAPIDDSRAPNALNRSWLTTMLDNLSGKYNPMLANQRASAQQALAGYGGWKWAKDDPATKGIDEGLAVPVKDPSAMLGVREERAVHGQRATANASGMLYSSFANKAVGAALGQLNEEAKAIVSQYASNINSILSSQRDETSGIMGEIVRLYGEDSRYLAENPPPRPEAFPQPPGPVTPQVGMAEQAFLGTTPTPATSSDPAKWSSLNIVKWDSKPNYTAAQIEAKFGPGARLVRPDNGSYWTVLLPNGGGYATK
jgi:hypothetical protein